MDERPLRLMVFDRTCRAHLGGRLGLSSAWRAGGALYRALDRLDRSRAVASWAEALGWLAEVAAGHPLGEIQFWGHGKWGMALLDGVPLDRSALRAGHRHHGALRAIRARLADDALWWFRTCETLGADPGHDFARAWCDFFDCRVGGHTYVIGFHQSGLHTLAPGQRPGWSAAEGLRQGTAAEPLRARPSRPWAPNTITCLHGRIPPGY